MTTVNTAWGIAIGAGVALLLVAYGLVHNRLLLAAIAVTLLAIFGVLRSIAGTLVRIEESIDAE